MVDLETTVLRFFHILDLYNHSADYKSNNDHTQEITNRPATEDWLGSEDAAGDGEGNVRVSFNAMQRFLSFVRLAYGGGDGAGSATGNVSRSGSTEALDGDGNVDHAEVLVSELARIFLP